MKPINIIILVALAVFLVALGVNFSESVSVYTDFNSAKQSGNQVHIVGTWVNRDQATYDPATDMFSFYMQDTIQTVELVRYRDPKPMNFEQTEKVVVIGGYQGEDFIAEKIVLKCPSKYEPTDITAGEK